MYNKLKFSYAAGTITATLISAALVLASSCLAGTATSPNPAPSVADILALTPQASDVFEEAENGEGARHLQSGLICPLVFPNLNLWHLEIFNSPMGVGTDVGCDYGRQGANGTWTAKLTIYAVKAGPGATVDQAFTRYQAEVKEVYPTAKSLGPAVKFKGEPPVGMEDVRSEEYEIHSNGKRYQSDLIVAVKNGWIIEIRGTTATDVATSEEAAKAVGDMGAPMMALMQALSSIKEQ